MDFALAPEQKALQAAARRFAREQMPAVARACEDADEPPSHEWRRRFADMGFLGVNTPAAYGGLGLGNLDAVLVLEEFAQISVAVAFPIFEALVGPVKAIERFGNEDLKRRVLPRVVKGEMQVAIAMSEPHAGSGLTDLTTKARMDGTHIVLDGQKRWTSGGGHAEGYVVYCRMSEAPGAKGIGAVFVERGTPGLSFGKREALMGFRGIPSADIHFDGVRVPAANLIVPAGGFGKLMEAFDLERCGNATMSLGIAAGALESALAYAQERKQFGKPIVDFQAIQMKLADMKMKVEAARLLIHRAVVNAAAGLPSVLDSSVAKCFANEMVREVTGLAVQLMGGYGYAKAYGAEQRMRDAWAWGIAGGTIDIQKINIAAAMAGRRFDQRK
jgi:butyryl-CoA dehydrogenase